MRKMILALTVALSALGLSAQQTFNLWPDGPADDNGADNEATLTVYHPADGVENTGKAIVICPGGGYAMLAIDHEGHQMARLLAEKGITAAVLKYRLPNGHHNIPADDAREAIRIMRRHAKEWGIAPDKIGISGFSAGGHLASTVLTHYKDTLSIPNFGVLFYPVISARPGITHDGSANNLLGEQVGDSRMVAEYSNDEKVDSHTPPTLLLLSTNDTTVPVDNSLQFYRQLATHGVATEMHIYPIGGHGWGMRKDFPYHDAVVSTMLAWIGRQ